VPLWTNRYDGPGNGPDAAVAIALDSTGNVFVTGYSAGIGTGRDYATIKYSGAGVPRWTNRYNGTGRDAGASAIAVDSSGNLFVTGGAQYSGAEDYATIKYSGAGMLLWTRRYNGPGNDFDYASAIAVDSSGNVFVTGYSIGSSQGNLDYATVAYSNVGMPLWTNRYSGLGNDEARAVAVDSSGNVFLTGDSATIAYSGLGMPLWTNLFGGFAIAVDSNGNVFVASESVGDYVTIKCSSSVPPSRLDFQLLSNQLVLSWTNAGFNLQSTPAITSTFTNLPGATSPYTNLLTAPQQFFRLKGN
jgi:hypothetical protein